MFCCRTVRSNTYTLSKYHARNKGYNFIYCFYAKTRMFFLGVVKSRYRVIVELFLTLYVSNDFGIVMNQFPPLILSYRQAECHQTEVPARKEIVSEIHHHHYLLYHWDTVRKMQRQYRCMLILLNCFLFVLCLLSQEK